MSTFNLVLAGCLMLAMLTSIGLTVLCLHCSRKAARANEIIRAFKDDNQGLYKRIEEMRELQSVLLCTLTPEQLKTEPWIMSWCESQERWLKQLAGELEPLSSDIARYGARGRKRYGL